MARVRFIGEGDTCEVFGAGFRRKRWTASHGLTDEQVALLADNPTFEVEAADSGSDPGDEAPADPEV